VFRPQSVAAHFPLMIAFQGHPDKGTERVDMGLFLIKAYIGGWYDSKSFPTDVFSRWLDSPPGVNWKGQGFTMKQIAYNLHGDTNSIEFLHSLYADLVSQGKGCIANTSFSEVATNHGVGGSNPLLSGLAAPPGASLLKESFIVELLFLSNIYLLFGKTKPTY
jgi:hypothetical protein